MNNKYSVAFFGQFSIAFNNVSIFITFFILVEKKNRYYSVRYPSIWKNSGFEVESKNLEDTQKGHDMLLIMVCVTEKALDTQAAVGKLNLDSWMLNLTNCKL